MSVLANEGLQHHTLKCYILALRYAQIARGLPSSFAGVCPQGGEEDTVQGREKPGEAMPPNNYSHSEMLAVGLVTWPP